MSRKRGQVVLEYILLLVVTLALSALLLRTLIGSPDSPNGIRSSWVNLLKQIGADIPDN